MQFSSTFVAKDEDTANVSSQNGRSWHRPSRAWSQSRIGTQRVERDHLVFWANTRAPLPFDYSNQKKKQRKKGSNAEKTVTDYKHGERNAKDLRKFLEYQMPNYVERVKFGRSDYDKVAAKANKYGLPIALIFTSKGTTSTTVKWLSTEFRRKLLIVEIPPTAQNESLRAELVGGGGNEDTNTSVLPAMYVLPPTVSSNNNADPDYGGIIAKKYDGDKFSRRKLEDFLNIHALPEPVLEPIIIVVDDDDTGNDKDAPKTKEEEVGEEEKKQSVGGDEF